MLQCGSPLAICDFMSSSNRVLISTTTMIVIVLSAVTVCLSIAGLFIKVVFWSSLAPIAVIRSSLRIESNLAAFRLTKAWFRIRAQSFPLAV